MKEPYAPSPEQPSFPEDTMPRDLKRHVVGIESYRGWGPYIGPIFYKAQVGEIVYDQDGNAYEQCHRHKQGVYNHNCRLCRVKYDRIVRGHDYEQLWYRSRAWFYKRAGLDIPN